MKKTERLKAIIRKKDILAYRQGAAGCVFETLKEWLERGYVDLVKIRLDQAFADYRDYCKNQDALDAEFNEVFEDRKCLHDVEEEVIGNNGEVIANINPEDGRADR
jgi:hypothetical protein